MEELIFTPEQKIVFDELAKSQALKERFYFTGGTALSVFYLQHRYSDDLDFFSNRPFDFNLALDFMNKVAVLLDSHLLFTDKERVVVFQLMRENQLLIKVDFGYYPYLTLKEGRVEQGVVIDSLFDIAVNKLLTINQRTEVKDFVDLYFLLQKDFSVWDLLYGVEAKFKMELDLIWLGADFLKKSRGFTFLPKMIKPLELSQLQRFFRALALEIGGKAIEA